MAIKIHCYLLLLIVKVCLVKTNVELCYYHTEHNLKAYIQCGDLKVINDVFYNNVDILKISKVQIGWNTTIPRLVYGLFTPFENLHFLILNNLNIESIDSRAFYNMGQLQELSLFNNKISRIRTLTFNYLYILRTLDLGTNKLSKLDENIFINLNYLEQLSLSWNKLNHINKGIFNGLRKLKILNLAGNEITTLNVNIFDNLRSLEVLDLSFNSITELSFMLFTNQINLQMLHLQSNLLKKLPDRLFENTTHLQYLDVSNNLLTSIDGKLFRTTTLEILKFEKNVISEINMTDLLSEAWRLEEVYLDLNPWKCNALEDAIVDIQLNEIYFKPGDVDDNGKHVYGILCKEDELDENYFY